MEPRRLEKPFAPAAGSTARVPAQSKSILEEVLRETVAGLSAAELEASLSDLSDADCKEPRTEFNQWAAKVLVRFATPQWARRLVADDPAWLALTSETARILLIDEEVRARLERIWLRIGE